MSSSLSYAKSPPDSTESVILQQARADSRPCSTDAVAAFRQTFKDDAEDPSLSEVEWFIARERFTAFDDELSRRIRIIKLDPVKSAQAAKDFADWAALAEEVKQRIDVKEVLQLAGFHIIEDRSGEAHSSCPLCGGRDRLVIWPKRCWCRQCDWRADAIAVAQSFLPGATHFRDAVKTLARLAAMEAAR